jgi:hypothetical protein
MNKNEITYEAIVGMESIGKYKSFNEAFIKFFEGINLTLEKGTSYQLLETTNFLVCTNSLIVIGVMPFYEARDFAYGIGLLVDGKIQQKVNEPTPDVVLKTYKKLTEKMVAAEFHGLLATLQQILKVTV